MSYNLNMDTLKYSKALQNVGFSVIQAEALAELNLELLNGSTATKGDISEVKAELKADIATVRTELSEVKAELKADIATVRTELSEVKAELKADIATVRTELKTEIAETNNKILASENRMMARMTKMIGWSIGVNVAMIAGLGGLIAALH